MSPNHISDTSDRESVTRKFNPGDKVIVERRIKDDNGRVIDRVPEDNWAVVREITTGEDAGKIVVRKLDAQGNIFLDENNQANEKYLTPAFLDSIQKKYEDPERPDVAGERLTTDEKREVGRESLAAAEIQEPGAPAPFSEGWSEYVAEKRRQEAMANPTAENPHWFDVPRPAQIMGVNGPYDVDAIGIYADEYSNVLAVRDPLDGEVLYLRDSEVTMLPNKPAQETVTNETSVEVDSEQTLGEESEPQPQPEATVEESATEAVEQGSSKEELLEKAAQAEVDLQAIFAEIPEIDRIPVWRYAVGVDANNASEIVRFGAAITDETKKTGIHEKYVASFAALKKARKDAGILQ